MLKERGIEWNGGRGTVETVRDGKLFLYEPSTLTCGRCLTE
jgi:hypothetical protein